jgi:hypothetical protein
MQVPARHALGTGRAAQIKCDAKMVSDKHKVAARVGPAREAAPRFAAGTRRAAWQAQEGIRIAQDLATPPLGMCGHLDQPLLGGLHSSRASRAGDGFGDVRGFLHHPQWSSSR